jgi:hypothetical protein
MTMSNPADDRITIRNRNTGEIAHGIRRRIPQGWEQFRQTAKAPEVKEPDQVETHGRVPSAKSGGDKTVVHARVQAVRGEEGKPAGHGA